MNELNKSFNISNENKRYLFNLQVESLQQLILQRFQSLTTISLLAFAIAGIILSSYKNGIKNNILGFISASLFAFIALFGLGRFLYLIRKDINAISKGLKDTANTQSANESREFKPDYWPESLYILLIIGVILFGISFL